MVENKLKLAQIQERKYMTTHGQKYLIDFTDKERHMLRKYFENLDADGSGIKNYTKINYLLI